MAGAVQKPRLRGKERQTLMELKEGSVMSNEVIPKYLPCASTPLPLPTRAVWQLREIIQRAGSGARLPGFESRFYLSLAVTSDALL